MKNLNGPKAIALVSTALFVASLFWLMNTIRINSTLETGVEKEKLRSEELLSEKLLLEKEMQKFRDQLGALKNRNTELDNLVNSTSAQLKSREAEYNKMKNQNLSLAQVRKQRQELIALQKNLENEVEMLKNSNAELREKNTDLQKTVASLEERNKLLSEDLNRSLFAAVDQSQVHAVKGKKERLTIRASKTKKLIANFQVPANLKNLGFRISDSNGNVMTANDGTTSFTTVPSEKSYTASADNDIVGNSLQNVQMVFQPTEKLKTGVYTVEILNENLYVGSIKVKLK